MKHIFLFLFLIPAILLPASHSFGFSQSTEHCYIYTDDSGRSSVEGDRLVAFNPVSRIKIDFGYVITFLKGNNVVFVDYILSQCPQGITLGGGMPKSVRKAIRRAISEKRRITSSKRR